MALRGDQIGVIEPTRAPTAGQGLALNDRGLVPYQVTPVQVNTLVSNLTAFEGATAQLVTGNDRTFLVYDTTLSKWVSSSNNWTNS